MGKNKKIKNKKSVFNGKYKFSKTSGCYLSLFVYKKVTPMHQASIGIIKNYTHPTSII